MTTITTKMRAGLLLGSAVVFGMAAPLAHADGPDVGSGCAHYQNNAVVTASDGTRVRCTIGTGLGGVVSWVWLPDTGIPAPDRPNGCADCHAPGYPPAPPAAPSGPCYDPPTPGCPPRGLTPEQRANW
jgi:hypothetical protein